MLLLGTTDKLQLVTSAAATIDVEASFADWLAGAVTPKDPQLTAITTATTTDIVDAPAAGVRSLQSIFVRNKHASLSCDVTVLMDRSGTDYELHKTTLLAGQHLEYSQALGGFFVPESSAPALMLFNQAVSSQALADADVYLAGSYITFPRAPKVGTRYQMLFDTVKTAAGTTAPIIVVRLGTAGTTADTARCTLNSFGAQTAAADTARFQVDVVVRTAGATGVLQASGRLQHHLTTTGYSVGGGVVQVTSGAFDLTVASLGIGCSFEGGASHSGTLQYLHATLINP